MNTFILQGALRCLVSESANDFVNLVEEPCLCTLDVRPDFTWGSDLASTQFINSKAPIFTVKLHVNENQAYYSTDPAMFEVSFTVLGRSYSGSVFKQLHAHQYAKSGYKMSIHKRRACPLQANLYCQWTCAIGYRHS